MGTQPGAWNNGTCPDLRQAIVEWDEIYVCIKFDDVADGTMIDTKYTPLGVTFSSVVSESGHAYARSDIFAESLPNIVSLFQTGLPMFDARWGAVKAQFFKPQRTVSIDAMRMLPPEWFPPVLNKPFLEAWKTFDSSDNFLQKVLYPIDYGDNG